MIGIVTAFALNAIFPSDTPEGTRQAILNPFFDPPGSSSLMISQEDRIKFRNDPLNTPGFVWVIPPKGHCFLLTTDPERPDIKICEKTRVPFHVKEIDSGGKLTWRIVQGPVDDGTTISWQTPYRLANAVPLGEFTSGFNTNIPIYACIAKKEATGRKITLELFNEEKWYISFPDEDQLKEGKKNNPNLFVRVMTTSKDGKSSAEDASTQESGKPAITEDDVKRKHKILSLKLSGKYKEVVKKPYDFIISPYQAFEMNSGNFMGSGTPAGLNGKCRYKYSGADGDSESGAIECYNTDEFDAVYVHLTCSSEFSPNQNTNEK